MCRGIGVIAGAVVFGAGVSAGPRQPLSGLDMGTDRRRPVTRSAGGPPPDGLAADVRGGLLHSGALRCGDEPGTGLLLPSIQTLGGAADRGGVDVLMDPAPQFL